MSSLARPIASVRLAPKVSAYLLVHILWKSSNCGTRQWVSALKLKAAERDGAHDRFLASTASLWGAAVYRPWTNPQARDGFMVPVVGLLVGHQVTAAQQSIAGIFTVCSLAVSLVSHFPFSRSTNKINLMKTAPGNLFVVEDLRYDCYLPCQIFFVSSR